ncbi:MAG: zinc ribbon domain-containing protein [Nitrospirae bacterium]|nr:zinc ribbon domain-containing protein [Nitrospirota bacterium]
MPIYEYHCPHCEEDFEKLVFSSTVVECPKCGASDVNKKLSVFGVSGVESRGESTSSDSCGTCSSTSCSTCK